MIFSSIEHLESSSPATNLQFFLSYYWLWHPWGQGGCHIHLCISNPQLRASLSICYLNRITFSYDISYNTSFWTCSTSCMYLLQYWAEFWTNIITLVFPVYLLPSIVIPLVKPNKISWVSGHALMTCNESCLCWFLLFPLCRTLVSTLDDYYMYDLIY